MSMPSARTIRIMVLVGFFVVAFALYGSAEAGVDPLTYALMGLLVLLMLAGIYAG